MNGVKIWGIYRNPGTQFSELFYQVESVDVICGQNTALAFIWRDFYSWPIKCLWQILPSCEKVGMFLCICRTLGTQFSELLYKVEPGGVTAFEIMAVAFIV